MTSAMVARSRGAKSAADSARNWPTHRFVAAATPAIRSDFAQRLRAVGIGERERRDGAVRREASGLGDGRGLLRRHEAPP